MGLVLAFVLILKGFNMSWTTLPCLRISYICGRVVGNLGVVGK
jgi:hypothetical protein